MWYLGLRCRGEATGGVVIWWKLCWHKFFDTPFEKFRYAGKEEARPEGHIYEKVSRKVSRKPYSLVQYSIKQHYALDLMFAQFRKQQSQLYSFHSRGRTVLDSLETKLCNNNVNEPKSNRMRVGLVLVNLDPINGVFQEKNPNERTCQIERKKLVPLRNQ